MISLVFYCIMLTIFLLNFTFLKSQSLTTSKNISLSSRYLDSVLQDYAFRSFSGPHPKTGVVYDGNVTPELTGIKVSALRLRSGGLKRKGYYGYKEFDIPTGVFENPYVERLVLVYQNLGNWTSFYYQLPGYMFLSPIVGLLAYNASHLKAKKLPELDIRASKNPILIKFASLGVKSNKLGVKPKCVFFDLFGGVEFDHVVNGSVCLSLKQGHFGVVVEENVSEKGPVKEPENPIAIGGGGGGGGGGNDYEWLIGGMVVVGGGVFVLLVVVLWTSRRWKRRKRMEKMEYVTEGGVPLAVSAVGNAMMPVAMETRTKPILESEYVTM
uniref:uncharacterized protein LOC122581614 n=1 Tax=Erigeron canadensis TaxID=72917 RepID=UPI001CB8DF59|nr:uncharacterized protein LOC122581614 [Erigeron canadensis]